MERSEQESNSLPHDRYDIVTKDTIETYPEDFLRTVLGRTDFTFLEFVDGEFTTVEVRRTDNLIKVHLGGEIVLVHIEFQVDDSTSTSMVQRNVGYIGRCYEKYGLPILSHVIYLRPNAGRNDPGGFRQEVAGYRFIVEYKVIRLIELDGQSVLESENIGLMPFAPLMQPPSGMEKLHWAIQCNERTKSLSLPIDIRNDLLVSQWILSGLIHPNQAISDFLQEGIVRESSAYQHLLETTGKEHYERGIQQGVRQNALESLYSVLEHKFDSFALRLLLPSLENINDLQILKQLLNAALQAQNLEEFIQNWRTIEDEL